MKRLHGRWYVVVASTVVSTLTVGGSSLVSACSSSATSVPAADSGATGDEQPQELPTNDAGAPDVMPDTLDKACDPIAQDCTDPSLRCQLIFASGEWLTGCEPSIGSALVNEGQTCTRTKAGHDNCVTGLTCLPDGVTARSCHKICVKDAECGSGSKCNAVTTIGAPYFGACFKSCTPFSAECGGATCADALLDNTQLNVFEGCRPIGAGTVGSPCNSTYDCGADMNCQGSGGFTCKAMCDDTHPCATGTCKKDTLPGLPNNGGLCP